MKIHPVFCFYEKLLGVLLSDTKDSRKMEEDLREQFHMYENIHHLPSRTFGMLLRMKNEGMNTANTRETNTVCECFFRSLTNEFVDPAVSELFDEWIRHAGLHRSDFVTCSIEPPSSLNPQQITLNIDSPEAVEVLRLLLDHLTLKSGNQTILIHQTHVAQT